MKDVETTSGIRIRPLYGGEAGSGGTPLPAPGEPPYTRGIHPGMYRDRPWTIRQYAGFGTAAETNARFRYLLETGQLGLSVAFDLPTQMGYDADHAMAAGEVGRVGVAISSLEDMETLMDGLPLDRVSTSMTINSTAGILLAFYIAAAEKRGIPAEKLSGTVQNDVLKEYIARGTYIYPPAASLRIATDIFAFARRAVPKWNPISVSGYHIREAGSTAVEEVAFTLANGLTYLEAAVRAGLGVDELAPRLSFFFNVHNHLFEEAAKLRAARRLWARLVEERYHPKDPRSLMLRFHCQTAGATLQARETDVNVVRVTVQALAAVLGGTQSLHTNSWDEALSLPSEQAARLALRTQQVIATESGLCDTADPLGGSYYVEALTTEIESASRALIAEVEKQGGMLAAIESGFVRREIERSAYRYQRGVESGEIPVVGLNYPAGVRDEETGGVEPVFRLRPEVEREQKERLAAFRAQRDHDASARSLDALRGAARTGDNIMPHVLHAVRVHATLGEISDALRDVFGTYQPRG